MTLIPWLKITPVVLVVGAMATGVDLLAGRRTSGAEPQAEGSARPAGGGVVPATAVRPGKLRVAVAERGVVEASENEDVYCQVEGGTTILAIVPEGTLVQKGQVVCELDSSAFQVRQRQQRAAANKAEADYQNAKLSREVAEIAVVEYTQGVHQSELASLKDGIAAAEAAVQKAAARLIRTRSALERVNGMLTAKGRETTPAEIVAVLDLEDRLDAAEQTAAREKATLERTRTKRDMLEKYTRERTVKELQSEVEKAKSDEASRLQAWELARDEEAKLEKQIRNCKLLAPSDGIVVYANDPPRPSGLPTIEEGATVRERQKVFSLPNFKAPMRVIAKVPEAMIGRVVPGLAAAIKVDVLAKGTLAGTVQSVAPVPDPRHVGSITYYTTRVLMEKPYPGLRPGMVADLEIVITELDNVLSVPVASVIRFDDKDHVAVQKPGAGFDWRQVTLGLFNGERVEVKQGLQSGEFVIQDPFSVMSEEEKRQKLGAPAPLAEKPGVPR